MKGMNNRILSTVESERHQNFCFHCLNSNCSSGHIGRQRIPLPIFERTGSFGPILDESQVVDSMPEQYDVVQMEFVFPKTIPVKNLTVEDKSAIQYDRSTERSFFFPADGMMKHTIQHINQPMDSTHTLMHTFVAEIYLTNVK